MQLFCQGIVSRIPSEGSHMHMLNIDFLVVASEKLVTFGTIPHSPISNGSHNTSLLTYRKSLSWAYLAFTDIDLCIV